MTSKKPNRLITQKSPYLLQHAFNPVDWFPWCEEAFDVATKENRPIFLSIGYSTCHWCHVMEKESFEDESVAKLLNSSFVSIKVDREERPDIDKIYMDVCQLINGNGGWPLTIFMTHDKKPFFAGTYFPKNSRGGRIGFAELLSNISTYWKDKHAELLSSAEEITNHLSRVKDYSSDQKLDESVLHKAYKHFESQHDSVYGGFGSAPKFPSPHNLTFLLRYWYKYKEEKALLMVTKTLDQMFYGGLFDHIGFGFHRYSTDKKWLLPHFEKMLYDQAMMIFIYTEAFQVTKNELYKDIVDKIIFYIHRELKSEDGGFYSAEDADSEGIEGKYSVWTVEEINHVLSPEDSKLFCKVYNVTTEGNFKDEATHSLNGNNIPHLNKSLIDLSIELNIPSEVLLEKLKRINHILLQERQKRIKPLRDSKILTDWNGLTIAAVSFAGRVFNKSYYIESALEALQFINGNLYDENSQLFHSCIGGSRKTVANLDDYSFLIWGLLELYQSTFDESHIIKANSLTEKVINYFWDCDYNGFFFTSKHSEKLISRSKEIYDGAIPSGNSVMINNLIKLGRITGKAEYEKYAELSLQSFAGLISQIPFGTSQSLNSLMHLLGVGYELIIVPGEIKNTKTETHNTLASEFYPFLIEMLKGDSPSSIDYLNNYQAINSATTYYLCSNYSCQNPTTDITEILEQLAN